LGLAPDTLYSLTFKEFGNAVRGKREHLDNIERSSWERTRWQTAILLNVHVKKGSKVKPRDLAIFPWEEQEIKESPKGDGWAVFKALAKQRSNG
jgi:hypothetical protein